MCVSMQLSASSLLPLCFLPILPFLLFFSSSSFLLFFNSPSSLFSYVSLFSFFLLSLSPPSTLDSFTIYPFSSTQPSNPRLVCCPAIEPCDKQSPSAARGFSRFGSPKVIETQSKMADLQGDCSSSPSATSMSLYFFYFLFLFYLRYP